MKYSDINDVLSEKITGEWGTEPIDGSGVKIIRTANFTNLGIIDYSNIVLRNIESSKVEKKKLETGDIIIEKSGGSPTQPVGRVVYFENPDNSVYLCNNFTTVLRPNRMVIFPKFLFYVLFYNHLIKKTLRFQNKTTGIINLKLEKYLESQIPLPPLPEQIAIANILSKAEALIAKRKESLALLDEYLKSTFLEMFGDPVRNEKGWERGSLNSILKKIESGWSPICEDSPRKNISEWGILKLSAVTYEVFNPNENKKLIPETEIKKKIEVKQGDLLFARKNTIELVGSSAYVFEDAPKLLLSDLIFKLIYDNAQVNGIFLWKMLCELRKRKQFHKIASGTAGSMPNISQERLLGLLVPVPPLELQNQFAAVVEKVEALKEKYQKGLGELENLYGSLSQRAFRGELG